MKIVCFLFSILFVIFSTQQVAKLGIAKILESENNIELEKTVENLNTQNIFPFLYLVQQPHLITLKYVASLHPSYFYPPVILKSYDRFVYSDCSPPSLS